MKLSQFVIFVLAAVLMGQVRANPLSMLLQVESNLESMLVSDNFQKNEEDLINTDLSVDGLKAKATLAELTRLGSSIVGDIPLPGKIALKSVLQAVRLVHAVKSQVNEAIKEAQRLVDSGEPEMAIDAIKKGFQADREMIFMTGVPLHDGQGSVLALSGGEAFPNVKENIVKIQRAGTEMFGAMQLADEIATLGIKAGGNAAAAALKAAKKTIEAGVSAVYRHLTNSAKNALNGLMGLMSKGINKISNVNGVIESLKTNAVCNSTNAMIAIARLDKGLSETLKVVTKPEVIAAAKVVHQGLKSTIMETADAISDAQDTLEEAGVLAYVNPEKAIAAVHKGFRKAEDEILSGSAPGYLGVGASGQIAAQISPDVVTRLVPAVLEIENGRVAAFEELSLAERAALIVIRDGGDSEADGKDAASSICEAAGSILYQDYADAGDICFDVFKTL